MRDLISRQAAIKAVEELQDCYNGFSDTYDKACIIGVLEEVPAAPVREVKRGKWLYGYCSCCGERTVWDETDYCPNCGADNREDE